MADAAPEASNVGWQHMKSRSSVSSRGVASSSVRREGDLFLRRDEADDERFAMRGGARGLGSNLIDDAPARALDQPGAGVLGHAGEGPLRDRGDEGLLHGVLRCGEVAEPPHDDPQRLRRELAQKVLGGPIRRGPSALIRQVFGRAAHHLAHFDRHVERSAAGTGRGRGFRRRSRRLARGSRPQRSRSRPGTPSASGNTPSVMGCPLAGAHELGLDRGWTAPRPTRARPLPPSFFAKPFKERDVRS